MQEAYLPHNNGRNAAPPFASYAGGSDREKRGNAPDETG